MSGDDYRTSDDDDDTEKKYTRPVFVSEHRRKAYTGTTSQAEDHHYLCDRPVKRPQHRREGTQSTTIRLVPATMDRPKSRQKKKKKKREHNQSWHRAIRVRRKHSRLQVRYHRERNEPLETER